jgi:Tfp pilus assembly protein PilX
MMLRRFLKRATPAAPRDTDAVRRDGFALPLAIMVLALLTMGLVAGFAASASEMSTSASQRAQARAYSFAQMGLEQFLTQRKRVLNSAGAVDTFCKHCWAVNKSAANGSVKANLDTLPTKKETTYVAFTGGSAVVRSVPIWTDVTNGKGTYFVSSTGTDNSSATLAGFGKTVKATRTVGVLVKWNKTTMNVMGALVSFSGVDKNGTGVISGNDACGSGTNVAGLTVPSEQSVTVAGSSFTPSGNPPYDTLKTFSQDSAQSGLNWASIKDGSGIQADIIIGSDAFPATGAFSADTNYWPIIHVTNAPSSNWTLPNKGRGMLIVDGGLTINGSNQWDGVILVGGQLISNGNNVSSGTVMSGLNLLTGGTAGVTVADATLNGQKSYVYNSCSVAKATSAFRRYTVIPNTWMDNVASY